MTPSILVLLQITATEHPVAECTECCHLIIPNLKLLQSVYSCAPQGNKEWTHSARYPPGNVTGVSTQMGPKPDHRTPTYSLQENFVREFWFQMWLNSTKALCSDVHGGENRLLKVQCIPNIQPLPITVSINAGAIQNLLA